MPTIGTQLNVMIDPDKRDRFKNKVRGEGKTINEVVNELIDAYLANTNLPNQANQYELEEAIANSKKFEEVTMALEKHDKRLELLSRMIEEIKNKLDSATITSDSNNNQVNQEDEREVTPISSEGEEIVTPEKLPSEDEQEGALNENQDILVIEAAQPVREGKSEDVPGSDSNCETELDEITSTEIPNIITPQQIPTKQSEILSNKTDETGNETDQTLLETSVRDKPLNEDDTKENPKEKTSNTIIPENLISENPQEKSSDEKNQQIPYPTRESFTDLMSSELNDEELANLSNRIKKEGLCDKELSVLLTKMERKVSYQNVNKWRNEKRQPSGSNKNLFNEFEVRDNRWFLRSSSVLKFESGLIIIGKL